MLQDGVFTFGDDGTTIIGCPEDIQGDIVIPDGVIIIKERAFDNCREITSVYVPDSVKEIKHSAFNE